MNSGFQLADSPSVDARKGFSRWVSPGVDVYVGKRRARASASFWLDPGGRLLVRFTCARYVDHFEIVPPDGKTISSGDQETVVEFVSERLVRWMAEDFEAEAVWDM